MDNRITLFVSSKGNDQFPGSEEKPFLTFERARDEIRKLKHMNPDTAFSVLVREGTYYFKQTLSLSAEDSGNMNGNVEYMAYPGEKPVISGGRKVEGTWSHYRDGIMMCHLNDKELMNYDFTQIFVNGKRQHRARYPDYDPSCPGFSGYTYPADAELEWPHMEFKYDPAKFTDKKWAKPEEAVVHMFDAIGIGNIQWRVSGVDWDTYTIKLGKGGFQMNDVWAGRVVSGIDQRSRYFIENVFEELDCPGEWYFDKEKNVLYIMPEVGTDLNNALIEASCLKHVIELRGSEDNPVHHITFSGFRIAHTETTYLDEYEAPSLGDWTIHRGGAVFFEGVEDCSIEKCFFDAVGGNAVFLNNYNRRNRIYGNTVIEAGDSAICMVGSRRMAIGSNHPYSAEITVSNNLIHDIGVFGKQTAGVFMSVSMDNIISHNHIYNLPRAAICINDSTWGGHIVEYNNIHDTVRETTDHGPFNSWGRDRFWCLQQSHGPVSHCAGDVKQDAQKTTVVRNNRFEDYTWWGPVLDDGSSNFHVYNNLCIGCGIKAREGDYRLIENNIIINPVDPPGFNVGYENNSDCFTKNIIVISSDDDNEKIQSIDWGGMKGFDAVFNNGKSSSRMLRFAGPPMKGPWFKMWDYNLYFNYAGGFKANVIFRPFEDNRQKDYSFKEWQEAGIDIHSLFEDPMFIDLENRDFRLHPDSSAFKLGFKEFDMNSYGLIDK
jgi:hypothetical protein